MKVLVTGATGFVGSAVARALIARGDAVRLLRRSNSDTRNVGDLAAETVIGDLCDKNAIRRAAAGVEAIFHVAADYRLWVPNPKTMFDANVEGTRHVMEAALEAGVGRIVYTSSVATLGLKADSTPADETTPATYADMIGPYKQSKFAAERLVEKLIAERGLPAVIVHPSTPIGPRDIKPTPTGKIVVEAARGRMPAFVDTGLNVVHVDDVADGHLLAFDRGEIGAHYILGGDNLRLAEILAGIARLSGREAPWVKLPHGLIMPIAALAELWAGISGREPFVTRDGLRLSRKMMFFSSTKAMRDLGYRPRPPMGALADAIDWFGTNGYLH